MATPISIANIARVAAGAIALLWALVALGDALAALTARGLDVLLAAEIATGAALATGAVMSFGRRRWWRPVLVIAAAALTVPILRHAFGRSLGTGLMVLLIPAYVAWFAVGQFEHRRKAFLVPAWFACIGVAAVCLGVHATRVSLADLLAPLR